LIANTVNRAKHEERRLPSKKTESSFITRRTPDFSFDASLEYDKLERLTNRYETARNDLLAVQQKCLEFGLRGKLNGKGLREVTEEHEVGVNKLDKSFEELYDRYFQRQDGLSRLFLASQKPVRS
jgi:hypothetical protein